MTVRHLHQLLEPRSVALIGASARPGSVGHTVWRNLQAFGGARHAVNRRAGALPGETSHTRVADLPEAPDLAIVCTPPATVPGLVAELGERGTRAVIVITGGLSREQKQAALDAARPHLLRILGPNCLGLVTPRLGLNASFAHRMPADGRIAFVSQSGALVTAVIDWAAERGIGFSHLVSIGERSDVDFGDLLDHLASDGHTQAILLYIESIESPRKFMSAARAAARNKPVIVVKAGRAGHGVAAAASHTGALAGSDIVFDAAIRRAGMLRVDTLQELFLAAETLARLDLQRDSALMLVTNGGGAGVLAADAAAALGLPLEDLTPQLQATLDGVLPASWSRANPIDIIGDAPVERYVGTLEALLAAPGARTVLLMHAPTAIVDSDAIAQAVVPLAQAAPGRLMTSWLGGAAVRAARERCRAAGIADHETPEEAVRAFALARTWRRNRALLTEAPAADELAPPDLASARAVVAGVLAEGREMLDEVEAKRVLAAFGIPTVPTVATAATADAAVAATAAAGMTWPVALKIRSRDLSHKSDVGGVALDLRDTEALRSAAERMLARIAAVAPQARIDGFSVQPMAQRPKAEELIVGASIDPLFGPVVLFGQGGTAVEVVGDRAIALPPLNRVLAHEVVQRTRVARLLAGYRDRPPARMEAVHDVLIAVSQMLVDLPELAELDINPLWADADGVLALDARIRVSATRPAGAARLAIVPYPAHLAETVAWEGQALLLRPVRPEDEALHAEFLQRLSPEDLRLRFFCGRREVPRAERARLVQIDYAREMAFVALAPTGADGAQEMLAVARAATDPDNVEAEFAIAVRSDLQGRGLGRLMLARLLRHLAAAGTQRVVGDVLHGNARMLALAHDLGFQVQGRAHHTDAVRVVRVLAPQA
jgi:acetyltransferase